MIRKMMGAALLVALMAAGCAPKAITPPPLTAPVEATPAEPDVAPTAPLASGVLELTGIPSTQPPSGPIEAPSLGPISVDEASLLVEVAHVDAPGARAIAISPLSDTLASAEGNTIILYNLPFPAGVVKLEGHTAPVTGVSWSPDGQQVASSSEDGSLRLWDATAGQQLSKFDIDPGGVTTVTWSSDGLIIAAADTHGIVHLLDGQSGDAINTVDVGEGSAVNAITWSSDGTQFAVMTWNGEANPGSVAIVDLSEDTPKVKKQRAENTLAPGSTGAAWSPLEDVVAWVNNGDGRQVYLWTLGDKQDTLIFKGQGQVNSIAWGPDGDMLATGGNDHTILIWKVADGSPLATLRGHTGAVQTVAWSPDGTFLVTAGADGVIRIWGVPAG